MTPVVAVWFDEALHFTKGAEEQKASNLRANSHVILTTCCNGWQDGLDVVLEGEAVLLTRENLLGRLSEAWLAKWDRPWKFLCAGWPL